LKKWIPDYHDDDDENKEILSLIFDYLRPTLTELKKKAEQRVYLNIQSTEKKEKIKSLFEKFEVLSANIQLFKKGIQDVEGSLQFHAFTFFQNNCQNLRVYYLLKCIFFLLVFRTASQCARQVPFENVMY
jgi:hypothetical protein